MTLLRFDSLAASAFRNATAQLPMGLWVALAHRDDAAAEFTRVLSGVQKPSAGSVSFDAQVPYSNPAVRRSLAAVLPRENYQFASTVREALESVALYRGLNLKPEAVLGPLDLQHLASRRTTRLTQPEAQQISIALAMAQADARLAIVYEPFLALRDSQIRSFQDWLSEASQRACVVCVTSSSHDAQLLGGPHAHLTLRGWEPAALSTPNVTSRSIFLEGRNVHGLASALALESRFQVLHLSSSTRAESLHVTGLPSDVSAKQIIARARGTGATVSRLWTEVTSPASRWEPVLEAPNFPDARVPATLTRSRFSLRAFIDEARFSLRPMLTPLAAAILALEPSLAWAYGALKHTGDRAWATYDTLVFAGTILTPLWSLWITQLLLSGQRSAEEPQGVARFGISRKTAVLCRILTGSALAFSLSALAAVFGMLGAWSGRSLAPAVSELYQSSWIIGLGGAVYGGIALFLSTFRRRWFLCWAFILLDFALGGGSRGISFPFPRAHIHNLLGSPSSILFQQQGSCVYLVLLLMLAVGLMLAKTEA